MTSVHLLNITSSVCAKGVIGFVQGQSKNIIIVKKSYFKQIVSFFMWSCVLQFNMLMDLVVIDRPNNIKRFEVSYVLLSITNNMRVIIKVFTMASQVMPSLMGLFASSNWLEREAWDMFGVFFDGHTDLRRLLTDYGFLGHPLRKDFPLTGFYELRYDDSLKMVVWEPVEFAQEMRSYYSLNSWKVRN